MYISDDHNQPRSPSTAPTLHDAMYSDFDEEGFLDEVRHLVDSGYGTEPRRTQVTSETEGERSEDELGL